MTPEEERFVTDLFATTSAELADLRKATDDLAQRTRALLDADVDTAWANIEKAAERIVEKSRRPLSKEQAVARVLTEKPELYAAYQEAQAGRVAVLERSRDRSTRRELAESAVEQLAVLTVKAMAAGVDDEAAVDWAVSARPDLVAACGVEMPEQVEKGDSALSAIDEAARAEMRRDHSLSYAVAVSRVLGRQPELYERYRAARDAPGGPDGSEEEASPVGSPKPRRKAARTAVSRDILGAPFRQRLREAEERLKDWDKYKKQRAQAQEVPR